MPEFGGENKESDVRAQEIMKKLCPEREIIAVDARDILTVVEIFIVLHSRFRKEERE